jgi:hypothetical protein
VAITDLDQGKAESVAKDFGISKVLAGVHEAAAYAQENAVFDIAVPASLCCRCCHNYLMAPLSSCKNRWGKHSPKLDRFLRFVEPSG